MLDRLTPALREADGSRVRQTLNGKALATLTTTRGNDRATVLGRHPLEEAVRALPPAVVRLIRTLAHRSTWF